MYKVEHASGGDRVSGWINVLFPHLGDDPTSEDRNPAVTARRGEAPISLELPRAGDLPTGLASAPFTWKLLDGGHAMQWVAGHLGVQQDPVTLAVRPVMAWAVAEAQPLRQFIVSSPYANGVYRVSPRASSSLTDLRGMGAELDELDKVSLSLMWCRELGSLAGLAEVRGLRELYILEASALTDLDGLAGLQALEWVSVGQCVNLRDAQGLAGLGALHTLALTRCPSLQDVSFLPSLPSLSLLHLQHCPAVPEAYRKSWSVSEEIEALCRALWGEAGSSA